jgi:ABC-type Fe3+-citrate transport system substrate-binding protein
VTTQDKIRLFLKKKVNKKKNRKLKLEFHSKSFEKALQKLPDNTRAQRLIRDEARAETMAIREDDLRVLISFPVRVSSISVVCTAARS